MKEREEEEEGMMIGWTNEKDRREVMEKRGKEITV